MAATKGHGNPAWTRDETILALALYHRIGGRISAANSEGISELSRTLRSLPIHAIENRQPSFRNDASVRFKLQNLHGAITGRGLDHISKMDRQVADAFGNRQKDTKQISEAIHRQAQLLSPHDFGQHPEETEEVFQEGRILSKTHFVRERSGRLRKKLLARHEKNGLECQICGMSKPALPRFLQESLFEIHHIQPIAEYGPTDQTKLSDLALLCACCHRAIHRLISVQGEWISVATARNTIHPC